MDTLDKALARIEKNIQERAKETSQQSAKIVQLPLWSEPVRGTPNQALRGALFAGIQGKQAKYMLREEILASPKGFNIRFTGKQLTQTDLDVWEEALHLAKQQPLGSKIEFTAHAFLKALGRSTGKPMHEWLKDSFARLNACSVEITDSREQKTYFGSLIEGGARDDDTGRYVLQINPQMLRLFDTGWTEIDFKQRQLLRRKPLAQWLHGFLATHKEPHPMKVETYHKLSGSNTKQLKRFKEALSKALTELQKIYYIRGFEIKDGLVHIERTANDIQKIHAPKPNISHR